MALVFFAKVKKTAIVSCKKRPRTEGSYKNKSRPVFRVAFRAVRFSPGTPGGVSLRRHTSFRWSLSAACLPDCVIQAGYTSAPAVGRCHCHHGHGGKGSEVAKKRSGEVVSCDRAKHRTFPHSYIQRDSFAPTHCLSAWLAMTVLSLV